MGTITRALTLAGLSIAATAAFAAPASALSGHSPSHHTRGGAVFVQTDDPAGNSIVAYHRDAHGTLTDAHSYATGGNGGVLAGSVVDHTASQGALTADARHRLLFAVNAGSNSVSVFAVHGDRLQLRQVIGSGGEFPVSVTVHGDLVYVLNARAGGSIQGYVEVDGGLVRIDEWHRALGLDATATPEFTHTPGQVAFSPDGRHVLVTTKAASNSILVYNVGRFGTLSNLPTVWSEDGSVPFALAFDRSGHLAVAEAGTNAVATFRIAGNGKLTGLGSAPTGQQATCWVAASGHLLAVSNAGSGNVSTFTTDWSGQLTHGTEYATGAGTVDASFTPDGHALYVQAGATGEVDGFAVSPTGTLTSIGAVTVPGAAGDEGIVAL